MNQLIESMYKTTHTLITGVSRKTPMLCDSSVKLIVT